MVVSLSDLSTYYAIKCWTAFGWCTYWAVNFLYFLGKGHIVNAFWVIYEVLLTCQVSEFVVLVLRTRTTNSPT